ncbi:TetR/AcrR family transcriptional regulator [Morganella morganii]|uniref:TetR/AcrR family transcriptional regulator n=1 Tax=Morganella morganii TaxID=582 RepID=UPI001FFD16FF|nr:TetR/AcrR family transcriptional regulator [Morganella morganii]MDT5424117.1 TetR/AcrR family transcriptional regulator [Morganella morganii]
MTSSRIPPCGRPAHRGSKLTAENILSEAGKLLQEQGKVPSIRVLAAQLQVDPMAIYYYFRNKQALLEAIGTGPGATGASAAGRKLSASALYLQ